MWKIDDSFSTYQSDKRYTNHSISRELWKSYISCMCELRWMALYESSAGSNGWPCESTLVEGKWLQPRQRSKSSSIWIGRTFYLWSSWLSNILGPPPYTSLLCPLRDTLPHVWPRIEGSDTVSCPHNAQRQADLDRRTIYVVRPIWMERMRRDDGFQNLGRCKWRDGSKEISEEEFWSGDIWQSGRLRYQRWVLGSEYASGQVHRADTVS